MRLTRRLALGALAFVMPVAIPDAHAAAAPGQLDPDELDDPTLDLLWGLDQIGASSAWQVSTGEGITVAVVDSGADLGHEDLEGQISTHATCLGTQGNPAACTEGGSAGRDDSGHGTHVAGIIGARAGNGAGVAGVAPDADLMIVKVLQQSCSVSGCEPSGTSSDVSAGIRWAVDHGADVINLSVGSVAQTVLGSSFEDALNYAWQKGAIPIVAAGNDIVLDSGFTGDEPAIVVGALNSSGMAALYSNGVGNAAWAVSAPGGEQDDQESCAPGTVPHGILSTYWDGATAEDDYACLAGTSMAAPHVAGGAALLRGAGLSAQETVDRLLSTAADRGLPGPDPTYGAGALDLEAALSGVRPPAGTTTTAPGLIGGPSTLPPTTAPAVTSTEPPASSPPISAGPPESDPRVSVSDPALGAAPEIEPTGARRKTEPDTVWVSVAVLMVVAVGSSNLWWLTRGAGWARRTPLGSVRP